MDEMRRNELIAQYADGHRVVVAALEGITDAEMDAREGLGEWSPRQIIHHLADSEMMSAARLRRLLVEDGPVMQGYDQEAFARGLPYDLPIDGSLAVFKSVREANTPILRWMTREDWQRSGTHSDSGAYGTERWLEILAVHAHGHADQIRRARAAAHMVEHNADRMIE